MFTEQQLRFVQKPRIGRLGSTMRNGAPHVSPVWYTFEDGHFLVLCERGSQKHRNIERDPRIVFCIDDERPPYHTVLVRGHALIEEAPGREWRTVMAIHYLGDENGRRYIDGNMHPNDIMLRIVPEKVSGR
jgi:PPOX class probable F420-dependent enzyme